MVKLGMTRLLGICVFQMDAGNNIGGAKRKWIQTSANPISEISLLRIYDLRNNNLHYCFVSVSWRRIC